MQYHCAVQFTSRFEPYKYLCYYRDKQPAASDRIFILHLPISLLKPEMKTAVFAFFGLVATAFSAKVDLSTVGGVMASGHGNVTAAAAADEHSGAASGSVDGNGAVLGMAQVGGALSGALSSPYL